MVDSVGAGAARGLQAGWQMGMQADQAERQRVNDERQQAQQDRQFGLQQDAATRAQAAADRVAQRQSDEDEYGLIDKQHKDLIAQRAAMAATGQDPTPDFNEQVIANRAAYRAHLERRLPKLAVEQGDATRLFSDMQAGKVDPATVDPAKFYRSFSLATRMTPADLSSAAQGAQLVQQGHETGDKRTVLQGVNQLMASRLQTGLGTPSPHGGVIVKKEIEDLVPVKDANGVEHPDKVFPVMRVYVRHSKSGKDDDSYIAPMSEQGSSDPNDPPKAINLANAFEYMGKVGTLAMMIQQHPEIAAKLTEGEAKVGAQTKADVEAMNAVGAYTMQAAAKGADAQFYALLQRQVNLGQMTQEDADKAWAVRTKVAAPAKAAPPPAAGVQREKMNLEQVDAAEKAGEITPEQAAKERQDIRLGARGRIAVPPPQKPAAAAKGGMGMGAGTGGGGTSAKYSKDADYAKSVDFWAQTMGNGGDLPPGFARANAAMYSDIVARAPAFSKGATDAMASRAEYKGATAGARTVGQRAANFGMAKAEAYEMADLVTETSEAVSRTKFMPINRAILAYEKNTGDPEVVQFGAAINSFINAYARAVSPVGTPTVSDKNHAREMLEAQQSHEQVVATIAQLKKEMVAAGNAPKTVRNEQRASIVGMGEGRGGTGTQPVAPMTGSGAPKGAVPALPPGFKEF